MGHYAKVLDDKVVQVIVAEPEFFEKFVDTSPGEWIQTSYNTYANQHLLGGTPLRGNYAGVGYTYDRVNDVFIPPKPFPNYVLNTETWQWEPPSETLPTLLKAEPVINGAIVSFLPPLTMPMGSYSWEYLYENANGTHIEPFVNDGSNVVVINNMNEGTSYAINIAMVVGETRLWAIKDLVVTPIYEPPQVNRNAP